MAIAKRRDLIAPSDHELFDREFNPGDKPFISGIFRCSCGDEIAANMHQPLPPQNHHQHPFTSPVKWKLLVMAVQKP